MGRVLITGASGFIGNHLKKTMPHAIGLDVRPSGTTDIVMDVCDLKPTTHWDIIYHLAAIANIEDCVKNPLESLRVNIGGTLNILQMDFDLLVFPSSVGVSQPYKNPYAYAKHICEEIIKMSGKSYLIFRFANIYGEGSRGVIQKFIKEPEITIYGSGKQVRDFTYIDDLVTYLKKCNYLGKNQLYYIGTGVPTSINKVARIISKYQNKRIVYKETREFDIIRPIIKADIKCRTTIEEGIKKCL